MNSKLERYAVETLQKLVDPGLLLVGAKKDGQPNVMSIGWGFVGVLWRKPTFAVAVRPSRYTHEFIEDGGEFTVNVPGEGLDETVAYCGRVSGRKHDKLKERNLTLARGKKVHVPVIKECKIHFECRVVHKLELAPDLVPDAAKQVFYPKNDFHTVYFGEILAAYQKTSSPRS
jgi:flavin reductase (DIM6/NTAB) family NADH-FMN oxidoreductase RutF